ncbi:MAG TPA: type II toxin-antitoxin system RelE/ParE family toxin [Spirochaeta sp.]|nr:type II toxin-antitoxin system RelE/ParE family toxin [Spirochaeta sp.]
MYQIIITEPASNDITSIVNYISNILKNPSAAESHLTGIEKGIKELQEMPMKYQKAADDYLSKKNIRCFTVKNYYIFYRVDEKEKSVVIIRVLYASRNWAFILTND